jgi:hypothetical protein
VVDDELGGTSGLIFAGVAAEVGHRVAHRGEVDDGRARPVKSCITTRAGVKAISLLGSAFASQVRSASMSSA